MNLIEALGGNYKAEPCGLAWMREWFGTDNFQNIVLVDVADCDDPEKYLGQVASLPRLETLVVGGLTFTDEHLSRLERLVTLSGLVLDSTDVSDDGIESLKQTLPELAIHKSQRRAIVVLEQSAAVVVSKQLGGTLPQLRRLVGEDYFKHVTTADYYTPVQASDAGLEKFKGLTSLRSLDLSFSQVSDAGLAHLKGFTGLQDLCLEHTQVSDAGVKELQQALPNCTIILTRWDRLMGRR